MKGILRKWKAIIKVAAAICFVLNVCCAALPDVYAANIVQISYHIKYGQTEARQMLKRINEWRTGDTWYWNSDDQTKTMIKAGERSALIYDYGLEKVAMQRAAELVLYYSHTRPNNSDPFTAYKDCNVNINGGGENIAFGQPNEQTVFNAWKEEEDAYDGQGHRRNMLQNRHIVSA